MENIASATASVLLSAPAMRPAAARVVKLTPPR